MSASTPDWNASAYHRLSAPQFGWGQRVLSRLALAGDETVLDLGCGSGRLTEALLALLPAGRVIAVDRSPDMARTARAHLAPRFGARVDVVRADLAALPFRAGAHAAFSAATFHWVHDHDALFAGIHRALVPGGVLEAQCGGGPNVALLHARAAGLMASPAFAAHFTAWRVPWRFETDVATAQRLRGAGFVDVRTWLEAAPTPFESAQAYREFIERIVLRDYLAPLPDEATRDRFLDALVAAAAADAPPFTLDYWRLNIHARKPA